MAFEFKITTTTASKLFTIVCANGTATGQVFNAYIDYGDGGLPKRVTAWNDGDLSNTYAVAGQYTISITGSFPNIYMFTSPDKLLIDEVVDLGDVGWKSFWRGFRGCANMTAFNVGTADTSLVSSTDSMLYGCTSLTSLDMSSFNTSNVTTMSSMFRGCTSLTSLDVSSFDTSNTTDLGILFYGCTSLASIDVSSFNTSNVTNMLGVFGEMAITSLDVSNFDTSNVTTMNAMFYGCSGLTTLGLSSFDTINVTNMADMFGACTNLTNLDIKHFNIYSVTTGQNFLLNSNNALTTTQYDELLNAWAAQPYPIPYTDPKFHFGTAKYTVGTITNWYNPGYNGAVFFSTVGNKLVITFDGYFGSWINGAAQQVDNLVVGTTYRFAGTISISGRRNINSQVIYLRVASDVSLATIVAEDSTALDSLTANFTFVATATTMYVGALSVNQALDETLIVEAGISLTEA
tara:strand:+ start:1115 stop:2497 length:1383 start_codon:yes stop_codon:yes gene_type:complete